MLTIFQTATDYSTRLESYLGTGVALTSTVDIGFYKPISDFYIEIKTPLVGGTLAVHYYDGTQYTAIPVISDGTVGLTKSGFLQWDRDSITPVEVSLHSQTLYWYKLVFDDGLIPVATVTFNAINLVLSNDDDLKSEYPNITDYLPTSTTTFIGFHEAARDQILSKLRVDGKIVGITQGESKQVDQWDLLHIEEFRRASKMLTLAKIFYWLSDAVNDKWFEKAKIYDELYRESMKLAYMSIDTDDDGAEDDIEHNSWQQGTLIRQ
jgi:hypothetical protein